MYKCKVVFQFAPTGPNFKLLFMKDIKKNNDNNKWLSYFFRR